MKTKVRDKRDESAEISINKMKDGQWFLNGMKLFLRLDQSKCFDVDEGQSVPYGGGGRGVPVHVEIAIVSPGDD